MSEKSIKDKATQTSTKNGDNPSVLVILEREKSNQLYPTNTYPSIVIENGKARYSTYEEDQSGSNSAHIHPINQARTSMNYDRSVVKSCSKCGFLGYPLIGQKLKRQSLLEKCCGCCRMRSERLKRSIEYYYQCENCGREWADRIDLINADVDQNDEDAEDSNNNK